MHYRASCATSFSVVCTFLRPLMTSRSLWKTGSCGLMTIPWTQIVAFIQTGPTGLRMRAGFRLCSRLSEQMARNTMPANAPSWNSPRMQTSSICFTCPFVRCYLPYSHSFWHSLYNSAHLETGSSTEVGPQRDSIQSRKLGD